jgi:glutaredoxin/glutathione-dependent peroxiredoxin
MTIRKGEHLPTGTLYEMTAAGPAPRTVEELTRGRRVIIVGLPGAFTPTCSSKHIPGFIAYYPELKQRGIDDILCVSVNDAYVMDAWGKVMGAEGKVRMLADGNADFARALGLSADMSARGMGIRSRRYSMFVEDGVVQSLNLDEPGKFEVSDACTLTEQLVQLPPGRP